MFVLFLYVSFLLQLMDNVLTGNDSYVQNVTGCSTFENLLQCQVSAPRSDLNYYSLGKNLYRMLQYLKIHISVVRVHTPPTVSPFWSQGDLSFPCFLRVL